MVDHSVMNRDQTAPDHGPVPETPTAAPGECRTCFFTSRFPGITLAEDGRCNQCHDPTLADPIHRHHSRSRDDLLAVAAEIKKTSRGPYDCIVGASGGLDSSYVLYIAKRIMGLNPLAIRYDNGLASPEAALNFETLCRTLEVDHRLVRSRGAYDRRYVYHFLRAMGDSDVTWGVCRFCSYVIHAVLYSTAVHEGVPTLLTSYNGYEGMLWMTRDFKLGVLRNALLRQIPWGLPRLIYHLLRAESNLLRLKREFYLPPVTNLLRRSPKSPPIRHVTVSRYIPWDIPTMVSTLERETGWRAPHPSLPMRFDCLLEDGRVNRTFLQTTGLTVHGIIANNLIHDGVRTKQDLAGVVRHYDEVIARRVDDVDELLRTTTTQ